MPDSRDVYVIDDDEAIRQSLSFLLRSAGLRTRMFGSAEAFLAEAARLGRGCVITDVRMPGMDGVDLVRRMREMGLSHRTIVMSGHGDVTLAVDAMKAGALDFIEKPFREDMLVRAVEAALGAEDLGVSVDKIRPSRAAALDGLSRREQEVLAQVVAGRTSKVIASGLGISPRTVEVYRASVMSKTGAGSLSELVRMALQAGL